MEEVRYITRWRLEKSDPKAALAEPNKPIVFSIGREVPDKWRPFLKKGVECAARDPKGCYTPAELLKDLVAAIFGELDAARPEVDLYRRNLQRTLVELLASLVNRDLPSNDLPSLSRGALQGISKILKALEGKDLEANTRLRFDDRRTRIERALDPRLAILATGPAWELISSVCEPETASGYGLSLFARVPGRARAAEPASPSR